MFDDYMRLIKNRVFNPLSRPFLAIPPWVLSLTGLLMGIATFIALWQQQYILGFVLWFLNRVFDALDGTVARLADKQSDFGGYLDILIDFIVYALIPIGLVLGRPLPINFIALAFLLASFYVNSASWMYLSAILEKRNRVQTDKQTTIEMPKGIIGGTETIIFYSLFILFSEWLVGLFTLMAGLVVLTIGQRLIWSTKRLT